MIKDSVKYQADYEAALVEAEEAGLSREMMRGHSPQYIRATVARGKPTKTYAEGRVVIAQGGRAVAFSDQSDPAPQTPTDSKIAAAAAKIPLHTIAYRALAGVARVFQFGRRKHGAGNYINATDVDAPSRYVGGVLRHLAACQGRGGIYSWESIAARDKESGLYELDHAICGLIMLRDVAIETGAMLEDLDFA